MRKVGKTLTPESKKLFIAGLLALVAAYIFASLAIDRGNWLYYSLTAVAVYLGGRYIYRALDLLKK